MAVARQRNVKFGDFGSSHDYLLLREAGRGVNEGFEFLETSRIKFEFRAGGFFGSRNGKRRMSAAGTRSKFEGARIDST